MRNLELNPALTWGLIVSLCDHSGAWSRPYVEEGYTVIRVDPKHGDVEHGGTGYTTGAAGNGAIVEMPDGGYGLGLTAGALADAIEANPAYLQERCGYPGGMPVVGVLMAPPCTDFASSGARWFAAKDADGRTEASIGIVRDCLRVKDLTRPEWWVLENPIGRLARCVPELGKPRMYFQPHEFAGWADDPASEAYTKRTALWGDFKSDLLLYNREPVMIERIAKDGRVLRGSWMWANLGGKSERTKELRSVTPEGFSRAFAEAQTRPALLRKQGD